MAERRAMSKKLRLEPTADDGTIDERGYQWQYTGT
jgi:hypothetical protein